ncbi:MAG: precorrin-6y C5,15-methyltransferase (decarboxylating) subunit CbiE [Verrucomicrobiales bacterium]|nr:precorrin-6y C5,15-methyltransferase (decarboxylating) subunit CbiE [Verrucomicrobiota bacterium JB025]
MKSITIVGCGPGGEQYVTPAARRAIEEARVLVGAARLLEMFPESGAERIVVTADIPRVLDAIADRYQENQVAVLVTGDPGLCSLARPVIRRFGRAGCRVIPGISSVHAAFASLGLDWYGARILSAHDTAPPMEPAALAADDTIALLAGNPANAGWVEALTATLLASHDIFLCENLTLPGESIRQLTHLTTPMKLASRSILIFKRKEDHA